MHYAVAIWNWVTEEARLPELIEEFVGFGYDAVSLSTAHLGRLEQAEVAAGAELVVEREVPVTLHGAVTVEPEALVQASEMFGKRLTCVTFDPCLVMEPRGRLYDAERMAPVVEGVLELPSQPRVGIEDFPLDQMAVDWFADDLASVLDHPRYGILIDIGHMNMRLHGGGYFEGMSVTEYIERVPLPMIEVHVHDNDGTRDAHAPLGEGTIDFAEVADALRSAGFDGMSTIEIAPTLHGRDPAKCRSAAREGLEHWRTLWED
ncbi:MAG: sugar phosphate isomerase/epimerase family protein [Armatimonadota bacterium]